MNKSVAFLIGFIFVMLPVASAGIIYDEETRQVSDIAGKWLNTWSAQPDTNWTTDAVQLDGQNLYFGDSEVGIDYSKHMAISDDGAYGAINYAQSGPGSELNSYLLSSVDGYGQYYGKEAHMLSDDGNYMIFGDEENDGGNPHVYFFGAEEGPIWTYEMENADNEVEDVAITHDGEYSVACASGTGDNMFLFERENNSLVHSASFGGKDCWTTTISANGAYAAWSSGGTDPYDTIVYDIENSQVAWTVTHDERAYDIQISGDGERLAMGLNGGVSDELLVYDTADGTLQWSQDVGDDVRVLSFNYDHSLVSVGTWSKYTILYNGITGTEIWNHLEERKYAQSLSDDGTWLATMGNEPSSLQVYSTSSSTPVMYNLLDEFPGGSGIEMDMSGDGHYIIVFDSEEHIHIFYDGHNGWDQTDSNPIWSRAVQCDCEVQISSGGTFSWTEEDAPQTINYGKIPIFSNSYNHDTPIYNDMWADDDHATDLADYEAIGDLEGLYLFEEGTGTTAKDYSGNGNDGALNPTGEPFWSNGKMGGGIRFDGVDDYVQIGDKFDDLTEISFGGWAKVDATTGVTQTIFSKYYSSFRIGITSSNYYVCELNGGATPWRYGPNAVGTEGEWHHHVCVYNKIDGSLKYYYDGALTSFSYSGDDIGWAPSGSQVNIGSHAGGAWAWGGDLDEIFLYSNDLSASDIAELYAISHDRMESGLVGHWRMEEGTGSTVEDLSGNGNIATITGASWDSGYFGNGLDFDGTATDLITIPGDNSLDFDASGSDGFTMAMWIKPDGFPVSNDDMIWGKYYTGGSGERSWRAALTPAGKFTWELSADGTTTNMGRCKTTNALPNPTEWHHVVFRWSLSEGTTCNNGIYIDGVAPAQFDNSGGTGLTNFFDSTATMGNYYNNNQKPFLGEMDEIQIWSRALSATEITDLYNLQYHGNPSRIDSAQSGRYVVSRTNSGEGGGGLSLFDTHSGTLATPKWTADIGPGDLVDFSDNAAPIIISGSTNGEVELYDLGGTQLMSYTSDLEITGVAIMDDNSYAFASSADHYVYGWDLDPLSAIPAWSTFVDGAVIDMGFDDGTIAVVTNDYVIALNTAGVEQWREKLQTTPAGVEFEAGRILIGYYTTHDEDDSFATIEDDADTSMYYKLGVPDLLYQFDSASTFNVNDPITDSSVNGFDGIVKDWYTVGQSYKSNGVIGSGLYSGSRQVEIPESPTFADDYTISLWLKPEVDDGTQRGMIQKVNFWSLGWTLVLQDCKVKAGFGSSTGSDYWSLQSGELCNAWHHVVMTLDKSETEVKLYVDGELVDTFNSALFAGEIEPINDMSLGGYSGGVNYVGYYDEIAIWDGKHSSETEVKQLFKDTKGRVYEVQDGLVGYWPLDNDADDYSSNGNDGTVTGAIPGEGHVGGAYEFSGADEITVSDNLDELTTSDEFTVQAWFNAPAGSGYRWIVSRGTSWGDGNLGIYLHGDGYIQASAHDVSSAQTITSTTDSWDDGRWHHVVYSYDGNKAKLYIDGRLDVSGVSVGDDILSHSTAEIKIGDRSGSNFIGNIDEVAIWDRSLDGNEIKQIFYKDQAQFQSSLLAYYPINRDGTGTIKDETSYYNYAEDINEMTLSGGVSLEEGKIYNGLEFDGVDEYGEIADASENFGGHGGMTWNMWVNPSGSAGNKVILDKSGVFRFYINPTGTFYGYIYLETSGENGGYGNCGPASPFEFDSWQMLTVTYDSSDTSLRYYYDGVQFYTCDLSTGSGTAAEGEPFASNTNAVCMAAQECDGTAANFYEGKVDETAIWSRALSIEEVGELYNSRTHDNQYLNQRGWSLFTSTGEKITDGYPELHTGGAIAEDGTIAVFRDEEIEEDDAIDRVYVYETTSNTATNFNGKDGTTIKFGDLSEAETVPLSASTWLKYGSQDTAEHFMGKDGSWGCYIDSSNRVRCDITGLTLSGTLRGGAGLATDGDWHNVIFTLSPTSAEIFIDGVSVSTMSVTGGALANTGDNFYIGDSSVWGGPAWEGQISDTRLYTEILTADDMASLASSDHRLSGNYASTIAVAKGWWKLNEDWTDGATTADDSSINNYDSTNIVGTLSTHYNNMQSRYAVFDGVEGTHIVTQENQIYGNNDLQTATLSAWIYVDNTAPSFETAVAYGRAWGTGIAQTGGFMIGAHSSSYTYNLHSTDGSGSFSRDTCNVDPNGDYSSSDNYGEWVHLTVKFDSTTGVTDSIESYINGNKAYTCSSVYSYVNTPSNSYYEKLSIGAVEWGGQAFEGFISDVRVFDTALSQDDITSLASSNPAITGNYAETFSTPIGWWKLNGYPNWAFDGDAADSSSNRNGGDHNGGVIYEHTDTAGYYEGIGDTEGKGKDYTGESEIRDVTFGNGGSTMVFAEGAYAYPGVAGRVGYYDSLGNGWQSSNFECYTCESFFIKTGGIVNTIFEDNRNLVWGTSYGNTEFKTPGLHPTSGNVIAFWQLQAGTGRPVYTKVVPQIVNNGTWWAGAMAISLEGDLWVESKYDGDGGQQYFALYKYDKLGTLETTLTQEAYPFMEKQIFNPDSRSSIDIATNGSVLLSIDNNFIYISEDTPKLLTIEGNEFSGPGQVKFLGDTGLVAISGAKGSANEYAVYNLHTNSVVWQFNADVTAFHIDASDNGDYIIFTNGTQMLFKAPTNNTLFTKAIAGVKAASVANNGIVAVASSTEGWFIYDKTGNLLLSGGSGQRVYDIDLDHAGKWFAVSGYDISKGSAWMEVWALEEDRPFYEKYDRAFRTEKSSDTGDIRSYRVMMGEGSIQVLWGWAGPGGSGAELYTFEYGITLMEILEANINLAFSTIILIAIVIAMIGFLRKMIKGSGIVG